ncbi:unnamed protein product [Urochloa humidicola]
MYGNYDGLNSPPVFDLYAGVNFWTTVNLTGIDFESQEAIVVVPDNFVQVCLINTGSGTPFISGLNLRPLKTYLYPQVNATQGLVLFARRNFGQTDGIHVRYPDDPHDRIWVPWFDATIWDVVSTMQRVQNYEMDRFEAPSKVMQTAITPRNASKNIEFVWNSMMSHKDRSLPGYMLITHFSELNLLTSSDVREFNINLNGELWWSHLRPRYLYSDAVYSTKPLRSDTRYKVSINATANSTLPPIINAVEIFSIISTTNVGTDSQDVSAMMVIKAEYQVKKNWMGDPCAAQTYAWDGLTCTYAAAPSPPRITGVNMSFTGLNGNVSSTFANLKAVQFLYLSHNNLNGSIPDALSQLPSLKVLDLTGNQLSGSIPPGLLKKIQDGSLNLIYADNPNLCTNGNSCPTAKGKSKLAIYIALPVALAVMVVLIFCLLMLKKRGSVNNPAKPQNEKLMTGHVPIGDEHEDRSLRLQDRRFTYKDLGTITNNFQRVIGRGGFGYVYEGFLEDGTQVAVKLQSQSSNQGAKEFLAEAQILARVHHKNLVSMIGYCKDGEYMALVYEYMSEGTLQEHIAPHHHHPVDAAAPGSGRHRGRVGRAHARRP